ncbi:unnamed protein product, partial [Polarella glacialis]
DVDSNTVTHSAAISACEKSAQWTWALRLFAEMARNRIERNAVTFGGVVSACTTGRVWELASTLVKELLLEGGLESNTIVFSAALTSCLQARKWAVALSLAGEMTARRVRPDPETSSTVACACRHGDQGSLAATLLDTVSRDSLLWLQTVAS